MNCLYTIYVLILHHKLFMFNLIIRVRIQTDHIQSSAYSPLRPLSINKPLQPAEKLSKKWLLDQDFWEISNMKCLFFRFGWLFYFRQNNRDKYPCRRGLLCDDCPVILQHVTENHVEINGVYYNSYYLCKWSSQPWFPSLCRCLRHKIPRWVPVAISELPAITKCMHDDLVTSTRWLCLINPEKKLCYSLLLKRKVSL